MDKGFKRKSDAVFEALGAIVKAEPGVVFLGGSAIQAILGKPRRLSIDLDLSFDSDPQRLVKAVHSAGFSVADRPSRNPLFILYKASRDGVEIKLDIGRFNIKPTELQTLQGIEVLTPKRSYLLAMKLSSLALGTIGRIKREPTQVVKDVFDINCLLDEKAAIHGMKKDWDGIVSDQNRLWKTSFTEVRCAMSAQQTLLDCLSLTANPFMPLSALSTFDDYLLSKRLSRPEFVAMSARALMLLVHMDEEFYALDAQVSQDSADKMKMAKAGEELVNSGVLSKTQVRELKVVVPKAMLDVLHWSRKRRGDDPILSGDLAGRIQSDTRDG